VHTDKALLSPAPVTAASKALYKFAFTLPLHRDYGLSATY